MKQSQTRTNQPRLVIASLLAGLAVTAVPGLVDEAAGQWALGDGTALDRNLRTGESYRLPAGRNFAAEARFRNGIVTGNAAQGLHFRGEVDYTSPYDFRSTVGTELSDSFRRDSLYSGLAGYGVRGTDALQYQFAMTTGSLPPPSLTGSLTTHRFGGGVRIKPLPAKAIGTVTSNTETLMKMESVDPFFDDRGKGLWTLRSTSAYASSMSYQPSKLKMVGTPEGDTFALTASSLRGLEMVSLGTTADLIGNSPSAIAEQRASRRGMNREIYPAMPAGEVGATPGALIGSPLNFHTEMSRRYDAYATWRTGTAPADTSDNWRTSVQTLREYLASPLPALPERNASAIELPEMPAGITPEAIELLRNAPGQFESLVLRDPDLIDAYGQHMKAGEALMAKGRFFDAEERFTRALAFEPGDEFAAVSRISAQIGAGLFNSAALNLRGQLQEHPEAIALRLSAGLMPAEQRLRTICTRLRSNIADERNRARDDSALLLAFIGFQSRENVKIREGLDALENVSPSDRLVPVLRTLWLSDEVPDRP